MTDELIQLDITFGTAGRFQGEILSKRTIQHFQSKEDLKDIASALRESLAHTIDFPELKQTCVSDDHVVIALDQETPRADAILAMVWKELSSAEIVPENVLILQSASWQETNNADPRSLLPKDIQDRITLKQHDPTDETACVYLASTTVGERIYLAKEMIDADLVIPIGPATFDPLLGFRGEASILYPAFSDTEAIMKFIGSGHDELSPTDSRPLRQQVEEIGWLLGIQFVMSVVPGQGKGVQAIFAGLAEAVARESKAELQSTCRLEVKERADLVLVAVEEETAGHTWDQIAAAIDTARRVVNRDGRIVVLSQLAQQQGPGLEILSVVRTPNDALKPIQQACPPDYLAATRIAKAVDWANVYLLSELPTGTVEDLFMIPLDTEQEVQKLIQGDDTIIVVESAQKVFANCQ